MNKSINFIRCFAQAEDGANVVEYALVIALVALVLALGLSTVVGGGVQAGIVVLVTRIGNCLAPGAAAC